MASCKKAIVRNMSLIIILLAVVTRLETVRLLAALAVGFDLKSHLVDIISVCLNGILGEEICMKILCLLEDMCRILEREENESNSWIQAKNMLIYFKRGGTGRFSKKSLYGLREAARSGMLYLIYFLKKIG